MSNGKRNLFATMAGFLVRAEAAESRRFGSSKKYLEIGNDLLAVNGSAAPQQGLVALRIDFDHAKSFQQAADPLRGAVRPSLESGGGGLELARPAKGNLPDPAAELVATIGLQLHRPARTAVGNQQAMSLI